MKILIIISLFLIAQSNLLAQPQWKFHIAFEDATGAKDTIWLIWDATATGGVIGLVDTLLGEGKTSINDAQFNTFLINDNYDSTRTLAYPFQYSLYVEVKAINYIPPINISWDTLLFNNSGIPLPVGFVNVASISNDYFFLVNNFPEAHLFNMLIDNLVIAPDFIWGTQHQFPMNIYIARDPNLGVNDKNRFDSTIRLFPNPAYDNIIIKADSRLTYVELSSTDGKFIVSIKLHETKKYEYLLDISQIPSGLYFLKVINSVNKIYYEKIIINH